jgi:hypothetical protein
MAIVTRAAVVSGAHEMNGYCWLGIPQGLVDALRNTNTDHATEASVWALAVFQLQRGRKRIELGAKFQIQVESKEGSIRVSVLKAEIQSHIEGPEKGEDSAFATLVSRVPYDDCESEAYVLVRISNNRFAVTGCFMADAVTAYRTGELKLFRASKLHEALVELPLPSNSVGSSALHSVGSADAAKYFRKVGTVIKGPDVRSNFLGRKSQDEYIRDAMAELAFAKLNNLVWNGNPFCRCGPAGEDIYIQSVGANDTRQLVLNAQHRDSNIVVLAVVDGETVSFIGWTPVSEAKKREWIIEDNQNGPTYIVPLEALRNMEDLDLDVCQQLNLFVLNPGARA